MVVLAINIQLLALLKPIKKTGDIHFPAFLNSAKKHNYKTINPVFGS
jgi:hypothetical protein